MKSSPVLPHINIGVHSEPRHGWRNKWRCMVEMAEDEDVMTGAEIVRRYGDEWLSPTLHATQAIAEAVARDCIECSLREGVTPNDYLGAFYE